MKHDHFLLLLLCLTPLKGQDNGIEQSLEFTTAPTGESILRWDGKTGRSYFIQVSDAANHLGKWNWAPIIESGNDEEISYEVDATADKGFFRLKHTDLALDPGETVDTSDFDKDGISNSGEVIPPPSTVGGATDPLNADTDGDGLNDGFERNNGFNPNNSDENENGIPDGEDDNDGDGLTNAEEQTLGTNPDNADTDNDGIPDKDETTNGTNPTTDDTDGDLAKDGQDADPNDSLVSWAPTPESSYVLIEVDVPEDAGYAQDLNDKGEVLFGNGIWSGGDRVPKVHETITGVYPISTSFPDPLPYEVHVGQWDFFNNDGTVLQTTLVHPTEGPGIDAAAFCPIFWPVGQSTPSIFYETADLWEDQYQYCKALGLSSSGTVAMWVRSYSHDETSPPPSIRIDLFDSAGSRVGGLDGTDGYHPMPGGYFGNMTSSGWIVSNLGRDATATQGSAFKIGLWDAAGAPVPLPSEAAGVGSPVIATDMPTGKAAVVAGVAVGDDIVGRVFLPDSDGHYQYDSNLSALGLHLFAGDGTAMTDDGKLWRNGKLIPLRDLCDDIRELLDGGWQIRPLKANKHGMYLISAEGPNGEAITKLLVSVRFELRNPQDVAQGWDNTGRDSKNRITPWTCCGVNRKDSQGNDSPNSIIKLTIPGCTQEIGNLFELAEETAAGGNTYVSLANQTITGETTNFSIQGVLATPAGGCKISVRQKALPTSRSWPLNVHVLTPRVIEFQVYLASSDATSPLSVLPPNVPTVAAIKTELEATYRNQANITFHELNANATVLNNLADVFVNPDGSVTNRIIPNTNPTKTYTELLAEKPGQAKHLKIFIVRNIVDRKFVPNANPPNTETVLGMAAHPGDWAIVEAGQPMDVYSHETGHSLVLTTKEGTDKTNHEEFGAPTPYGVKPLMSHSVGGSRWIRQEDWKTANTQAFFDGRYGH